MVMEGEALITQDNKFKKYIFLTNYGYSYRCGHAEFSDIISLFLERKTTEKQAMF